MGISTTAWVVAKDLDFPSDIQALGEELGFTTLVDNRRIDLFESTSVMQHPVLGRLVKAIRFQRFSGPSKVPSIVLLPHLVCLDNKAPLSAVQNAEANRYCAKYPAFTNEYCIELIYRLLQLLHGKSPGKIHGQIQQEKVYDVSGSTSLQVAENYFKPGTSLWSMLKSNGLISQPKRERLILVSHVVRQDMLATLSSRLDRSFSQIGASMELLVEHFEHWQDRIKERAWDNNVLYVGVTGGAGDPITPETRLLLESLDHCHIPYRVFSDATLGNSFAINDQVPHLLELAGATTYRVQGVDGQENTWYLGLDIGHPRRHDNSVLVVSLVSSDGGLLAYWKFPQARDETMRAETLSRVTPLIKEFINGSKDKPSSIVALRDGRFFKNDGVDGFVQALPVETALLEIIKNPVPLLLDGNKQAIPGTVVEISREEDALLQSSSPLVRGQIGKPIRVRIRSNPLGISLASYAQAIFGLCHAPSLGLRNTRVPAPIYWSNGLAKEAGQSIQFGGLNHVPHN